MNQLDSHRDVISLIRSSMPQRQDGEPIFRTPWHSRIFALMVTLVKDDKMEWKAFQERLVHELKEHQTPEARLSAEEVDLQYFDCWLRAAEETLLETGFIEGSDITNQIEHIKSNVADIRVQQLGGNHH